MKTLFAALSLTLLSFGAFCQQITTTKKPPTTQKAVVADSYRCPVCGATSAKAGDCAKDKVTLVKVGDYYCPDCYMSSKKPGKCEMCGVPMKQMASK